LREDVPLNQVGLAAPQLFEFFNQRRKEDTWSVQYNQVTPV